MGNTGQGYDVCSVFDLCLLAPLSQSPSFSQILSSSLHRPRHRFFPSATTLLSPPPALFFCQSLSPLLSLFPSGCDADRPSLCCSASVVVKCLCPEEPRPGRTGPSGVNRPELGERSPKTALHEESKGQTRPASTTIYLAYILTCMGGVYCIRSNIFR